ncbi:MAG TPA: Re/Si-specific NAD(P)(+) transhydrogenase subunit alpha [Egicoccus sp.]|nr:Re/Si-specific NAD(P)(+) transhydrogenase subunit alpha [Egicoccus sp.]HSK24485.1 Re/Si-specific NAD(P)(+) transhydrogenase subunit alpha [Egicoccus sp.]
MAASTETALFVVRERAPGERRVAATPDSVRRQVGKGLTVLVEHGAGDAAGFPDQAYADAGARLVDASAVGDASLVARVAPPSVEEVERLDPDTVLLTFLAPHRNIDTVRALTERKVSTLAMDMVPRITRAQSIDALSSQANVAGYRAVIEAAYHLDKYFPLFMTAAGTIRPARLVILGAGVAGLQAVATAKRLGAVIHVSDIREAAREEVASLGGTFIEVPEIEDATGEGGYAKEVGESFLERQRAVLTEFLSQAHAVITTAQIPGRPAPELITREMLEAMQPGSVVIDLAAADGGNCALTEVGRVVEHDGVRIIPGNDFPSAMPGEASALYARNVSAFVELLVDDERGLHLDRDDEVVAGSLVTHAGEVTAQRIAELLGGKDD